MAGMARGADDHMAHMRAADMAAPGATPSAAQQDHALPAQAAGC